MTSLRQSLLIWTIVIITMCHCSPLNTQKKSVVNKVTDFLTSKMSKISDTSVTSFSKTMASSVVGYYMSQVESGLGIAILNSMRSRVLVNPRLFLARGKTVGPPLLMTPHRYDPKSCSLHHVSFPSLSNHPISQIQSGKKLKCQNICSLSDQWRSQPGDLVMLKLC